MNDFETGWVKSWRGNSLWKIFVAFQVVAQLLKISVLDLEHQCRIEGIVSD